MTKYVAIAVTLCASFQIAHAMPQAQTDGGVGDVSASAQLMFWDHNVASSIVNSNFAAGGQVLGWSANPNAAISIPGGLGGFSGGGGGGFGGGGGAGIPAGGSGALGGSSGFSGASANAFGSTAGVASQGASNPATNGAAGFSGSNSSSSSNSNAQNSPFVPTSVITYNPNALVQNADVSVPDGGSTVVMLGAALSVFALMAQRKSRRA